jgi:hypothetical protein
VTRNSGWQAVDAAIVEARALRQQQSETPPATSEPRADRALRQPGDVSKG